MVQAMNRSLKLKCLDAIYLCRKKGYRFFDKGEYDYLKDNMTKKDLFLSTEDTIVKILIL